MSDPGGALVASVGAGLLGPGEASPFPLGKEAHLVELEVNGGAGAGTLGHFVATAVRPVETVDAEQLLDDAWSVFEAHAQANDESARALYAREWAAQSGMPRFTELRGRENPPPPPVSHTVIVPRWTEPHRLEVVFIRRLLSAERAVMENLDTTPCGFPSQDHRIAAPAFAAVEFGQRLQVTPEGAVTVLETFPPGILDQQGQFFAHVPTWSFTSLRQCPQLGVPPTGE